MTRIVFSYSNAAIRPGEEDGDIEINTISGVLTAKNKKQAEEYAMNICMANYPFDDGFIGHAVAVHGPITIIL